MRNRFDEQLDNLNNSLISMGALCETALAPCVAVVSEGSVTIVTEKEGLTSGETALVMTMAQAHAGVEPSGVRVVTAQAAQ